MPGIASRERLHSRRVVRRDPDGDDSVARLRVRPRRADRAVQRRLRARDRLLARRGARQRRARLRDPVRGARRVRRLPRLRVEDRHAEPAGRPLADQVRRAASDRVVQPPDDGDDGRPSRSSPPASTSPTASRSRTRTTARCSAIPRRSSSRSHGWPPSRRRCAASPRWSPPRSAPSGSSGPCRRSARGCCRSTRRRSSATAATAARRSSAATTATASTSWASARCSRPGRAPRSAASCAPARPPASTTGAACATTSEIAEAIFRVGYRSSAAAPIVVAGSLWGAVAITSEDPLPEDTEDRLGAFCELVSLAVASAQARADLIATRARLVEAGDEQRRRLERNLHDGAQQHLVTVAVKLRVARSQLEAKPEITARLLDEALQELGTGLEELREIARGLHPAILGEHGLGRALEVLAARLPVAVDARRPGRAAPRSPRGDDLLHRLRGADQRGQARGRRRGARDVAARRRRPALRDHRRRPRRRRRLPRQRASRACATAPRRRAGRSPSSARPAAEPWSAPRCRCRDDHAQALIAELAAVVSIQLIRPPDPPGPVVLGQQQVA